MYFLAGCGAPRARGSAKPTLYPRMLRQLRSLVQWCFERCDHPCTGCRVRDLQPLFSESSWISQGVICVRPAFEGVLTRAKPGGTIECWFMTHSPPFSFHWVQLGWLGVAKQGNRREREGGKGETCAVSRPTYLSIRCAIAEIELTACTESERRRRCCHT